VAIRADLFIQTKQGYGPAFPFYAEEKHDGNKNNNRA